MEETPVASLAIHFADLDDPREASGRRHQLLDIIAIAICATICGADNWVAIDETITNQGPGIHRTVDGYGADNER